MEIVTILKLVWLGGLLALAMAAMALALVAEHLRQRAAARGAVRSSDRDPAVEAVAPEPAVLRRRSLVS